MVFVSITRLRLRSIRFMPAFLYHAARTSRQASRSQGFLGGSLLADRKRTYWTMTLWHEEADMRRYILSGAHKRAMPRLAGWCDEASIVHWVQDHADAPDWDEADRRMRAEGRTSRLRHPSANQESMAYDPARTSRAVSIPIRA